MFGALRQNLSYNWKNNRRKAMKSLTMWALLIATVGGLAVFGLQRTQGMGTAEGGAAAVVNRVAISPAQVSEAVENLRHDPQMEQLQSLGPDVSRQMMQRQAVNQLIELELIRQANERNHILTSDAEVRDFIVNIPAFQENGQFQRSRYMAYLENTHKSPGEFENQIRSQQSLRQVFRIFTSALRPVDLAIEKQKSLAGMKADLDFVSIPTDNLVSPETVPAADVKKFLADAGNKAKIKDYFDTHKTDFSKQEEVKARHILIQAKAGDTAAEAKALEKIKEIQAKAKTEDFAKLAQTYSEDPGSKASGGLLDFFSRGRMVKEFEDAAFSLPVNQVSEPIKTNYGYHLIKVLEKKPAHEDKLEDVQETIAERLIARDRSQADMQMLEVELKKGDVAAVDKFVTDHKLKWEETGAFSIDADSVPKIGQNDEMAQMAFKLNAQQPLAQSLIRQGPRAYIARYKAVSPTAAKGEGSSKFDLNSDMMQEMMANRRNQATLQSWVDELRKDAQISIGGAVSSNAGPPPDSDF